MGSNGAFFARWCVSTAPRITTAVVARLSAVKYGSLPWGERVPVKAGDISHQKWVPFPPIYRKDLLL
jgi:hypothetical protein